MLSDSLKYDFPHGNKDPFEEGDENGNYFVYANAHSNLGNNLDEFNLDIGAKILCDRLKKHEIAHIHEEFDDGHFNISYRYNRSLELISEKIEG